MDITGWAAYDFRKHSIICVLHDSLLIVKVIVKEAIFRYNVTSIYAKIIRWWGQAPGSSNEPR